MLASTMQNADKAKAPVGLIWWHVSIGILVLFVMLLRLGWRLMYQAPPPKNIPVVLAGLHV
jgi:cytochrome b561